MPLVDKEAIDNVWKWNNDEHGNLMGYRNKIPLLGTGVYELELLMGL